MDYTASPESLSRPAVAYYVSPISGGATPFLWPPLPASPQSSSHPDFLNLAVLGRVKFAFQKGEFKLDLNPVAFSKLRREGIVT